MSLFFAFGVKENIVYYHAFLRAYANDLVKFFVVKPLVIQPSIIILSFITL